MIHSVLVLGSIFSAHPALDDRVLLEVGDPQLRLCSVPERRGHEVAVSVVREERAARVLAGSKDKTGYSLKRHVKEKKIVGKRPNNLATKLLWRR